jgi:hypothetical protein
MRSKGSMSSKGWSDGLNRFAGLRVQGFKVTLFSLCVLAPLRTLRETR